MEKFKIEHYENDHPGETFPWHKALQSSTAKDFKDALSVKLGLEVDTTSENLIGIILEKSNLIQDAQADSENFSISKILESRSIIPESNVYLNWYRFDEIDEIHFDNLNKYFDDIWYPGSDDIDIFDQTLSWILTVLHNGSVRILQVGT
nr:hypothetical protein [uncultured Desulfobacter sp.]